MKHTFAFAIVLCAVAGWLGLEYTASAKSSGETEIRANVEQKFCAAVRARDLDAIMSMYDHSDKLVAFDVVPPLQYVGWEAYKKDWQGFLGMFNGPIICELKDVNVTADGNLAYSHSIDHIAGELKDGGKADLILRATDVFQKTNGKWLIVHEHVSVPVDLSTGKAVLQATP